jgi:hypothetical protein
VSVLRHIAHAERVSKTTVARDLKKHAEQE